MSVATKHATKEETWFEMFVATRRATNQETVFKLEAREFSLAFSIIGILALLALAKSYIYFLIPYNTKFVLFGNPF